MPTSPKPKKLSLAQKHKQELCDCYDTSILPEAKHCTFQPFPDGWDFTPDVGNGQKRGEIFTPRWVVDKMITDSGMLPKEAVYAGDYSAPSSIALKCISSRINEPAVGTANYSATILYHKLRYAAVEAATNGKSLKSGKVSSRAKIDSNEKLARYHKLLLTAVASMYMFDIDSGNLQTTKQRLLGRPTPLNHHTAQSYWKEYLENWLYYSQGKKPTRKVAEAIAKQVDESLEAAHKNWHKFVKSGKGVIDTAYEEAVGQPMPAALNSQLRYILDKNIKLFNGIVRENTTDAAKGFYCPGWDGVNWIWWEFKEVAGNETDFVNSKKVVALKKMILSGELRQLKEKLANSKDYKERQGLAKQKKRLEEELYGVRIPGSLFG